MLRQNGSSVCQSDSVLDQTHNSRCCSTALPMMNISLNSLFVRCSSHLHDKMDD